MKRIIPRIFIAFALIICLYIAYCLISYSLLDMYTISNDGTTITSENGQEYINDTSTHLETVSLGKRIGKTNHSGTVYEIKEQPSYDWIAVNYSDEMSITEIVHKKQVNSFQITDKKIEKLRLVENKGLKQAFGIAIASTEEINILKELENSIKETGKHENINSNNVMTLQILFDEYKGIASAYYAIIADDNTVYISKFNDSNYIKAGPLLSKWVQKNSPSR